MRDWRATGEPARSAWHSVPWKLKAKNEAGQREEIGEIERQQSQKSGLPWRISRPPHSAHAARHRATVSSSKSKAHQGVIEALLYAGSGKVPGGGGCL